MKKFILLFILSYSATLFAQVPQDRNVLWVHGLGNDAHFWDRQYSNAQRYYRIRSSGFTHETNQGVQNYANRLRQDANPIKGSRTIGVGHSLGGVALRQANKDDNSLFGGIIAVGVPLDGARLVNAVISGEAERFVRQSVDNLKRGPIVSKSRGKWHKIRELIAAAINREVARQVNKLRSNRVSRQIISKEEERIHSLLIRLGVSFILDIINIENLTDDMSRTILDRFNPNDPSVRDLAENSSYLRSIRNFQSSQAKIIAWGNEDSPVHARLMASGITNDKIPNKAILYAYNELGNQYRITANGVRTGWNFFTCWRRCMRNARREKEAWHAGADYLKRGWEIAWNELTGARHLEEYTTTELTYVCDGGGTNPFQMIPFYRQSGCPSGLGFYYDPYSYSSCNPCRWEFRTVTRHRWVNAPSDGMIKAGSQKGEISNWYGGERKFVRLDGVNHMEMGVHEKSDKLFNDAFEGKHGDFFRTDKR